jgi:hypothetical protein
MDPNSHNQSIKLEAKVQPRYSTHERTTVNLEAKVERRTSRQIILTVHSREEGSDSHGLTEKRLRLRTIIPQVCEVFERRPFHLPALDLANDFSVAEHPSLERVFSPTHPEAPPPPRAGSVAPCPFSPTHPEATFSEDQTFPFSLTRPDASVFSALRISSDDV